MPVISADLTRQGGMPEAAELERRLLDGETLLAETSDHVLQVVGVLSIPRPSPIFAQRSSRPSAVMTCC